MEKEFLQEREAQPEIRLGLGAASQERPGDLHSGFRKHQPRGSEKANMVMKLK